MSDREIRSSIRQRWLFIGLAVVVIVIAGVLIRAPQSAAPPIALAADHRALGPADAPVTIIEYGDFGCPTCRTWHYSNVLNQMHDKYGNQVRFVWRDFPVITAQSPKAAEAGQCAADQDKFWEFHDLVYAKFQIDVDSLKADAAQLGLDTARFNQCLDSGQHKDDVNRDWQEAKSHGFRATPSFMINDKPFAGPPTLGILSSLIDPMLKSSN
jgi:protein-disulfide isomerase